MLNKLKKLIYLFLLFFINELNGISQVYPVQASIHLIPPYSLKLNDYLISGKENMIVNLLLSDLQQSSLEVKVEIKINGPNINLSTNRELLSEPITLFPGIPVRLTGSDLINFLAPENLDIQGYDQNRFIQSNGKLPEGFYRFEIIIADYQTGRTLAITAFTSAWLLLNDPPLIDLPKQNQIVRATSPQYINFQWTPRHQGSPNSAFNCEYKIELYEVTPESIDPGLIVQSTEPVFIHHTNHPFFIYGADAYPLIPGQKYAMCVKVEAKDIFYDLFRNEGKSEIRTFTYGVACNSPVNMTEDDVTSNSCHLFWEQEIAHSAYKIRLRQSNVQTSEWHTRTSFFNDYYFSDLRSNTQYEYQIQSICNDICSDFSESYQFTTSLKDTGSFSCKSVDVVLPSEKTRGSLKSLQPDDIITASDFKIRIHNCHSTGTSFSGVGSIIMPIFNDISIPVVFENIKISASGYLTQGKVFSYYDSTRVFLQKIAENNDLDDITVRVPQLTNDSLNNRYSSNTDTSNFSIRKDSTIYYKADKNLIMSDSVDSNLANNVGESFLDNEDGQVLSSENTKTNRYIENTSGNAIDSEEAKNQTLNDNEILFGPISFIPDSLYKGESQGVWTVFNEILGTISLQLHSGKIKKEFELTNAEVSYKQDSLGKNKDISIHWNGEIDIGETFIFSLIVKSVSLDVNETGNITGTVTLEPYVARSKFVGMFEVQEGISGTVTFEYDGSNGFNGSFNLTKVENFAMHLKRQEKLIASVNNVLFNKDKSTDCTFQQKEKASYTYGPAQLDVSNINLGIVINFKEKEIILKNGSGSLGLSKIPGIVGVFNFDLNILDNQYSAKYKHSNTPIVVFGMYISNPTFDVLVDSTFSVQQLNGSFQAKHPDFKSELVVSNFRINQGNLDELNASGDIEYNDLFLSLGNCCYQDSILSFSASASYVSETLNGNVQVNGLIINTEGDITLKEIRTELVTHLGPVKVEFESENSIKALRGEGLAKVYIQLNDENGNSEEIILSKATVSYKRKRDGSLKEGSIHWEGDIRIDRIGFLSAKIKKAYLEFENIEGKEIVKGNISLEAYLSEDKKIKDYIFLRKGIKGDFQYTYEGNQENFSGKFDFNGVENVNLDIVKSNQILASLKSGRLNSNGVLQGVISTDKDVSYNSGGFSLTLQHLELECSIHTRRKEFQLLSGAGVVLVKDMKGLKGTVNLGLVYANGNFEALVNSEKTEMEAFGMKFQNLNLTTYFDSTFSFNGFEGSVSIKHEDFDAAFSINDFQVMDGELKSLNIEGSTQYRGFIFDLQQAKYKNKELQISAKVAINTTGSSSWFDVDDFCIDSFGSITVGRIKGDLNYSKMHVAFNATFKDNAFNGKFNGDFLVMGFDGELDIGSTDSFNYGYLSLNAKTNIPFLPGFKITDLGGKIGYNYYLDFSDPSHPVGEPKEHNFIAGFKLGVGDNANIFALTAEPAVQFGDESFEFNFTGTVDMPRKKPVFKGMVNVNYKSVDESFCGNVGIECRIPSNSGRIINTNNINLQFYRTDSKFSLEGTNMSATVLSLLNFTGNIAYERINHEVTGEAISISGDISGSISYGYDVDFEYDWGGAEISGGVDVELGAEMTARFNNTECQGSFGGYIDVGGELKLSLFNDKLLWKVAAAAHAEASITYSQDFLELSAEADFTFITERKTYEAEHNFEKRWEIYQNSAMAQK